MQHLEGISRVLRLFAARLEDEYGLNRLMVTSRVILLPLVVATSSSDEKLERARSLGADFVVYYRREEHWGSRVREHLWQFRRGGRLEQNSNVT